LYSDYSLDHRLLKALEKLGFDQPTPVQAATLPPALEKKDLKVGAETGSGKTVAYLLPALQGFLQHSEENTNTLGLVLVPTRELARQVYKTFQQLARFSSLKAAIVMGGEEFKYQTALLRKNPELIVATPGRLVEHIQKGNVALNDLELLVIDEADRMLDLGFIEDIETIVTHCRAERQTLFFSATLKPKALSEFANGLLKSPETIILNSRENQQQTIAQRHILVDDKKHKQAITDYLLHHEPFKKCLIFTNTRIEADQLGAYLRYKDHHVVVLHGEKDQAERKAVIDRYRSGNAGIMVATDVAARGLDIKGIDLIVNFDMARNADDHIHRIGRTGRAGLSGTAISLVDHQEWHRFIRIENSTKQKIFRFTIEGLEAKFSGPQKKKIKEDAIKKKSLEKTPTQKAKERVRNRKNIGKPKRLTVATSVDSSSNTTPADITTSHHSAASKTVNKENLGKKNLRETPASTGPTDIHNGFSPIKRKKKNQTTPPHTDSLSE
jgi:ATP-dependent RNA helicase SrmB